MVPIFRFLIISLLFFSCEEKKMGVIHWSTQFKNLSQEKKYSDSLQKNSPWMVRYLDVVWEKNQAVPTAIAHLPTHLSIHTAAVFLQRKVLENTPKSQISSLAMKLHFMIENMEKGKTKSQEILLDFDWGKRTKSTYFQLITELTKIIPNKKISTTIRLSQYANPQIYGVPPSQKGLLMMYQTGSLNEPDQPLLWDQREVEKYLTKKNYPLPLDVAIPTFSWSKIQRKVSRASKKKISLVFPSYQEQLLRDKNFKQIKSNAFFCLNPHFFHGFLLLPGDVVTCEKVSKNDLKWALNEAKSLIDAEGIVYLYLVEEASKGGFPTDWFQ